MEIKEKIQNILQRRKRNDRISPNKITNKITNKIINKITNMTNLRFQAKKDGSELKCGF